MTNWEEQKFGDLYLIPSRNGLTRPSSVRGAGYKFINMGEIFAYNRIGRIETELVQLNEKEKKEMTLQKNDLLFARQSLVFAGAGKCSIVLDVEDVVSFESHIIRVRLNPEIANPMFYYYYFSLPYNSVKTIVQQCAQAGIRGSDLEKIKVPCPHIEIQNQIADILSAYDDLIEANNRRIELLEQTAQELYKEWFVRFRFPGYENVEFENGLPEGWERNKIQKYYNTCSGGTPSRSNPEYFESGVYPWVKTGEIKDCVIIDTEEYITQEAVNNSSAKVLPAKSVAMAMYGVNIGLLAYFDSEMTCNQACCVFSDKRDFSSKHYLYYYLKSIREYLLLISFGAAQQNLSQDLIKKIKITMPSDDVVQAFEKQVDDIYGNIRMLLLKNKNLAEQRDMLLPRLISGKLGVGQ
mgnify:CR=1 FL=1|jgi:type I restriction-modification system specificity subunit